MNETELPSDPDEDTLPETDAGLQEDDDMDCELGAPACNLGEACESCQ